ncbi:Obg-like ATPase [Candida viswanathii]|uniref:Obg-like ATPase homolog n=1 Tax=Candida viswanathii TaxID=5486 RepID=A0A367XT00_9ASCO|nr:Obg-like ATPase [Candida viswanathii]
MFHRAARHFTTSTTLLAKAPPTNAGKKILGRASNNLSVGLVGLANVGKSTFFQALTKSELGNPANYPFATIEPEKSLVLVPLDKLVHYAKIYGSQKMVPTNLTIWDIAGLVRNASSGAGLGNKFLNDIRQVDGILQIVRGFVDDEIVHIEDNKVDPVRDLVIVNDELILKDLEIIDLEVEKVKKLQKKPGLSAGHYNINLETLDKLSTLLYDGIKAVNGEWTDEEIEIINGLNLSTAKPTVYLLNVSKEDYGKQTNQFLEQVQDWITNNSPNDRLLMFSAEHETRLNELQDEELKGYVADVGRDSAIGDVVDEVRLVLSLISFFTCGDIEARQWTLRKGSTAPDAAGLIHTDLQKTFINSIVYKWDDLKELSEFDESKLKAQGKQHKCGKKYEVEDGDVLIIKAGGGKAR